MVVVLWHDVGRLCRFFFFCGGGGGGGGGRAVCCGLHARCPARRSLSGFPRLLVVSVLCVSFICLLFAAGLVVVVAQSDV